MQLTHAVLPGMIERCHGSVVTISSIAGKMALPFDPTYSGTKYGVAAFMRSLAAEMGRDPVSFSTIFPGLIREAGMGAPMDKTVPPALLPLWTRHPDDVAKAVVTAIRDRRTEIVVSRQPTTVPAVLNAIAPRLWNASAHTLTGRGKRLLRAIGR